MKKQTIQNIIYTIIVIIGFITAIYYFLKDNEEVKPTPEIIPSLEVQFVDVGQADCTLIRHQDHNILIDAGNNKDGKLLVKYFQDLGITKFDYVIGTHPHEDHIGGMKKVVESFDFGSIYMPKAETNTLTYENLLTAIQKKNKKIKTAKAKTRIVTSSDSYLKVETLAPNSSSYTDLNDYSVVIKVTYGKVRMLYMGDAGKDSENEMLNKNYNVSADVVKVGHHGSSSASTQKFINSVGAQYAIMSVGSDNDYGHPNSQTIDRWERSGAQVIRTDIYGDIVLTTNGDTFDIDTEKN